MLPPPPTNPPKTNDMTMGNLPFEDAFPIENGGFFTVMLVFSGVFENSVEKVSNLLNNQVALCGEFYLWLIQFDKGLR